MDRFVNSETTVGKTGKTLLWAGLSAALVAVLTQVVNKPELFTPVVVVLANVGLVLLKNFIDPKVKDF